MSNLSANQEDFKRETFAPGIAHSPYAVPGSMYPSNAAPVGSIHNSRHQPSKTPGAMAAVPGQRSKYAHQHLPLFVRPNARETLNYVP